MAAKNTSITRTNQNKTMTAQYAEYMSGPLPSAQQLERYEQILPGAADRIIKMAEVQSAHRQELEKSVVSANTRDSKLGVIFAFILGIAALASGTIVAINASEWPGALLGSSGMAGLAYVFIYGTQSSKKERAKKENELR